MSLKGTRMNGYNNGKESGIGLREILEKREAHLAGVEFRTRAVLLERTPLRSGAVSWGLGADVGVGAAQSVAACRRNLGNALNETCSKDCAARDCSCPRLVRWERHARGLGFMRAAP
ncbi:uncharacterized protein ColSpa_07004 [Colletotrichum spaethianum]|uniref:Uncharacterized protein n=1 Tax=Colletotrichum spaethianum TaxID=700344 RepID=A0AA37P2P1_9PEZI|nr:uncharacterized protein ColSpa_07004 [Colletotrichum spaethianum]GKT46823.1 hypothetical protein ColSpa_07004 [Colletotrichum spaethianum]